ncbi:MAG: rod shape-determining protein MreC [Cyclobacteriaceae bacterium]
MQDLLYFLYRYRTFGLFLLLEVICAWLIITYNNRQNATFLNSSNGLAAVINTASSNTTDYFNLRKVNETLVEENLLLREQLANQNLKKVTKDSTSKQYEFYKASVINNTFQRSQNYLTINAGLNDGIKAGMGVVSGRGVVGQVKSASGNYATVISLLHKDLLISSSLKRTRTLCTVQWDGTNPNEAALKYVPRHINVSIGDSVVTSGFNSIFPEAIPIGRVVSLNLEDNDVFYSAKIELDVDFSSLDNVFIIENKMKSEQDSLELKTTLP